VAETVSFLTVWSAIGSEAERLTSGDGARP
jgi:hypothetical protein